MLGWLRRSALLVVAVAVGLVVGAPAALGSGVSSPTLPDGRAYELVSTSGGFGEPYQPTSPLSFEVAGIVETGQPFQAAQSGEAVSYVGEPPAVGGAGETGPGEGNQWFASRTATGWITTAITPNLRTSEFPAYQAFSGDLSSGIFQGGAQPLTPGVPVGCRMLYARATDGTYRALFPASELPAGEVFNPCGYPLFAGASEHESQVIFQSEDALTRTAEAATEIPHGHEEHHETGFETGQPCMFGCNLYESEEGHLKLVSVLEGKNVPNATFGGYAPGDGQFTDFSNAISRDGSRVFWTDTQESSADFEHVYVLENGASDELVSGAGHAEYWTATPDGRYAFYTEAGELWRFDTQLNTRERLTAPNAGVEGVIGTNQTGGREDGAYIYFVATGDLAGNATEGQPNLYLRRENTTTHEVTTTFIATLSSQDDVIQTSSAAVHPGGDWKANMGQRTAEVSPDGQHLVFQSVNRLTGYDNETTAGRHIIEVFVYSANEGQLACASCDPTGAPPVIPNEAEIGATRLPESADSYTSLRRWMSENGNRVFFDSEQPLVPQDTNGVQDVYEWEREGEGTCAVQNPARSNHGCVFLLSGGSSQGFSFLIDADAPGSNVFFEHVGPLGQVVAPIDHNEIYDVRVDGGFAQAALGCSGSSCPPAPAPSPTFGAPASVTAVGLGNYPPQGPPKSKPQTHTHELTKACRAKSKKGRARCEREARRRAGHTHKSRSRAKGGKR